MNIHHIGYAVSCIEDALEKLTALGFIQESQVYDDKNRNVRILFMSNKVYKIELVAPHDIAKPSPVVGILSKKLAGPNYICYEVDSLKDSVEKFRTEGVLLLNLPPERELLNPMGFLFSRRIWVVLN